MKTSDLWRLQYVSFATSSRRLIYIVLKTSNLGRLENVWFTTSSERLIYDVLKTSVKQRLCSNVYRTSKEMIFSYFVLSEIFRKFQVFQFSLVSRHGNLDKSMDWFIYDRSLRHERVTILNNKFYRIRRHEREQFHMTFQYLWVSQQVVVKATLTN